MSNLDARLADWTMERLYELHSYDWRIKTISKSQDNIIKVERKIGEILKIAVVSYYKLEFSTVEWIFDKYEIDFLCNIRKEPFVNKDLIDFLEKNQIGFGNLGDLYRVADQDCNWPYINPEVGFILRSIKQHNKVKNIERVDSRRYKIDRYSLDSVVILALNDYEFTAECVRNGKEKYQNFQAILLSNPNAQLSSKAIDVADNMNIELLNLKELFRRLNRKWINT